MTERIPASLPRLVQLSSGALIGEKRREARYPTNDPAEVHTLPWSGSVVALPATVIDVSKSGLRLELQSLLGIGVRIEIMIKPRRLAIFGQVRYCRRSGSRFHAGVRIEDIVFPRPDNGHHIHDDEFVLYVAGRGLTAAEVLRLKDHVTKCEICEAKLATIGKEMNSSLRSAGHALGND
jgi:hypothetical protein